MRACLGLNQPMREGETTMAGIRQLGGKKLFTDAPDQPGSSLA
jgi:hypothetical protein